ncbi:MAG: hypothetical protein U5L01_16760 [Rheinheimera sp.]|nr:hypothetical protein [Rheinheimera sp.]
MDVAKHRYRNTQQLALTRLWLEPFLDRINEKFYPATTAGLSYNIYVQQHGLTLHSSGLSGNQIALLQDVLTEIQNFEFSPARFVELKAQLVRHWQNQVRNKPISQLFSQLSSLLQPMNPESEQLARELTAQVAKTSNSFVKICSTKCISSRG